MRILLIVLISGCGSSLLNILDCEELYLRGKYLVSAECAIKTGDEKGKILLALILAEKGYTDMAKEVIREYEGDDGWRSFVRGYIFYQKGEYRKAEKYFVVSIKTGFVNPDVYFHLVLTEVRLCKKESAYFYVKKLSETIYDEEFSDKLKLFVKSRLKKCGL